jgi:hypothetical protein
VCFWNDSGVNVEYRGPNLPAYVHLGDVPSAMFGRDCGITLTADALISDCADFSFVATLGDGTATVSPGGSYTPVFKGSKMACGTCDACCKEPPKQITIHFFREEKTENKFLFGDVTETCGEVDYEVIVDYDPDVPCVWSTYYGASSGYSNASPDRFPYDRMELAGSTGYIVISAMSVNYGGGGWGINSFPECPRTLEIRYGEIHYNSVTYFAFGVGYTEITSSYTHDVVLSKQLGNDFRAPSCDPSGWDKKISGNWRTGEEFQFFGGRESPYSTARIVCPPVEITFTVE